MRHKYPRTFHLPWSESKTKDDKTFTQKDIDEYFCNKEVVVTEKLDGENTTIYSDGYCHARSIDSKNHESRSFVKSLASKLSCDIPCGWRLLGENLYAKHSIKYNKLPSYFLLFGIVNENNISLSWADVLTYSNFWGLNTVPVIFEGKFDQNIIQKIKLKSEYSDESEGYVVRNKKEYNMIDFSKNVAKFVRKDHIQTKDHWMFSKIIKNELKEEKCQ